MYIQIEQTPNANALKFLVDDLYLESEFHYSNVPEESPEFIKKLFQLSEIERVYITSEFISISKKEHDLDSCNQLKSKIDKDIKKIYEFYGSQMWANSVNKERNTE